jgi:hypothetical protein
MTSEINAAMDPEDRKMNLFISLFCGVPLVNGLIAFFAKKFIEQDEISAQISKHAHYVDWWPATCKKIKEILSDFWSQRGAGGAAAGVVGLTFVGASLVESPKSKAIWDLANKITASCLNQFEFSGGWKSTDRGVWLFSSVLLPTLMGIGTTLCLGAYDVAQRYLKEDTRLEIEPVFSNSVQTELNEVLEQTRAFKDNGDHFQNLFLYGPPGTGKTSVSKWIAKHSEMNYVFLSGGDLAKSMNGTQGNNTVALQNLIVHAKNLKTPTLVFVDEAEACCFDRNTKNVNTKALPLVDAFLAATGESSTNIMFVFATNCPEKIDDAMLSRMHTQILIDLPQKTEREQIIRKTIDILFKLAEGAVFTPQIINHIAQQTDQFSGRDLFNLLNRLKGNMRLGKTINQTTIDSTITALKKQKEKLAAVKAKRTI